MPRFVFFRDYPAQSNQARTVFVIAPRALIATAAMFLLFYPASRRVVFARQSKSQVSPQASSSRRTLARMGPPRDVRLGSLPQATPQELAAHPPVFRPRNGLSDAQYYDLKARVSGARLPTHGLRLLPGDPITQPLDLTATANFDGLDQATACGGCTPADVALAVGPTYIVEAVNTSITVLNKAGVVEPGFPKDSFDFFKLSGIVPPGTYTTSARAFYDWHSSRYVVIMLTESDPFGSDNVGGLLIAASRTSDPTGDWWAYGPFQIGNAGECPDFPTLGQDHNKWPQEPLGGIYVGFNQFGPAPQACNGTLIQNYFFLLPKSPIYDGDSFTFWTLQHLDFGGVILDSLQPANVNNPADQLQTVFLVGSFNLLFGASGSHLCFGGCNQLAVWSIISPFGTPMDRHDFINTATTFSLPPSAHEPGCAGAHCVDTLDNRITGSVTYNSGSLYAALETIDPSGKTAQAGPLWFEIRPTVDSQGQIVDAPIRQENCFQCGKWPSNGSAYFATLQPDIQGNVTMVFNYSDDVTYPGVSYVGRTATQAVNTMSGTGSSLIKGQGQYSQAGWGQYSATALDSALNPADSSAWIAGMYARSGGTWATRVGSVKGTTTAVSGVKLTPTSLSFGTVLKGKTSPGRAVTLTDSGSAPLSITSIAASGDFAQTNNCHASLAAGISCAITITFTPTAGGPRKGGVRIADNAAGSPQTIMLTGVGTTASLSPSSLAFAGLKVGSVSAAQTVTLTDVGSSPINLWKIAIGGLNSGDFSRTTTCASSLAAKASCSVKVTFTPKAAGARTASVLVSDDGGGSPQAVKLTGTGL